MLRVPGQRVHTFEYENLQAADTGEAFEISVTVKNTGNREGVEIAQLYMQDVTASLVRPIKELKGYERVSLAAGEAKTVTFTLKKQDMGFYNNDAEYVVEKGLFRIYAGGTSRDCLSTEVRLS